MRVKHIIKNNPEFLDNYRVMRINNYITRLGHEYLILGARSPYSNLFTDIICTAEHEYISLGDEKNYFKTLEVAEHISLLDDTVRLLNSIAA